MRLTFRRVIWAEARKARSIRLPMASLAALAVAPVLLVLVRAAIGASEVEIDGARVLAECIGIAAIPSGVLAVALGVAIASADQVDGAVDAVYVATPRRRWVAAARMIVTAAMAGAAALLCLTIGLGAAVVVVASRSSSDLAMAPIVASAAASIVGQLLLAVLGASIATLVRSATGAAVVAALTVVAVPMLLGITGRAWLHPVTQLLPLPALQGAVHVDGAAAFPVQGTLPSDLSPGAALASLALWALGLAALALVMVAWLRPSAAPGRSHRASAAVRRRAALVGEIPRLRFAHLVRAEGAKLRSARTTWWLLGVAVAVVPLVASLAGALTTPEQMLPGTPTDADVAEVSATHLAAVLAGGMGVAQLPLAMLGALTIATEHGTRSWETTLLVAPRPRAVVVAKLIVVLVAVVLAMLVASVIAAFVATPLVAAAGFDVTDVVPVAVATCTRVLVIAIAVAALGVAVGSLVRNAAVSGAILAALLILAPTVFGQLQLLSRFTPWVVLANVGPFLPSGVLAAAPPLPEGASAPFLLEGGVVQLDAHGGLLVLVAWAASLAAIAIAMLPARSPR